MARSSRLARLVFLAAAGAGGEAAAQHEGPLGIPPLGIPPFGIPMSRHGSGTAWLPDESGMAAFHAETLGWRLMLHGNLFGGYDVQGSDAGGERFVGVGWLMGMASRDAGGGELGLRAMLSPEPLTVGAGGYPLLLQTGETFEGEPLVDRQHPHDLLMELAASYTREIAGGVGFRIYGGPAAEPALGPVAFPHRPSAAADPTAPIAHHWLDSTHITFGVATLGVLTRWAQLEGSWFRGREPDEGRYDLDLGPFDSASVRASASPHPSWTVQVSRGWLRSPEALEPEVDVVRTTASIGHATAMGRDGRWDTTLAWGRNDPDDGPGDDALLLETALDLGRWGTTFARGEVVGKRGHDFGLEEAREDEALPVAAVALGHVHPIFETAGLAARLGARLAVNLPGAALEPRYGSSSPLGGMVYLQLAPKPPPQPAREGPDRPEVDRDHEGHH